MYSLFLWKCGFLWTLFRCFCWSRCEEEDRGRGSDIQTQSHAHTDVGVLSALAGCVKWVMFWLLQTILQRYYLCLWADGWGNDFQISMYVYFQHWIEEQQITALSLISSQIHRHNLKLQTWVNIHLKIDPNIWPTWDGFDLTRQTLKFVWC